MGGLLGGRPEDQALTALAAGLLGGTGSFNQIAGRALMGAQDTYQGAQMADMKRRYYDSLMAENRAQSQERQMRQRQLQAQIDARQRFAESMSRAAVPQGFDMRAPGAQQQNFQPQWNEQRVLDGILAGFKPDELKAIAGGPNMGRPTVAGTLETTDAQGRPVTRMRDAYGAFVGDAMPKPYERKMEDFGGYKQGYDQYTGQLAGGQFGKTMTPDAVASNQLGWANNAVSRGQLGVAQANQALAQQRLQYEINNPSGSVVDTGSTQMFVPSRGRNGQPPMPQPLMVPAPQGTPPGMPAGALPLSGANMPAVPSMVPMRSPKAAHAATSLREEFAKLREVQAYKEVVPVINSAYKAADNPAGDLNIIYAVAKAMDPGSVVRESEQAMVVKAGSPAQRMEGLWGYVLGGGRLSQGQRRELLAELSTRGGAYAASYDAARQSYAGIASRRMVKPEDVFTDIPAIEKPPRAIKRTGTYNGRRVVEYSDGTVDYQ